MTVWSRIGTELREPAGGAGRLTGWAMRCANARPNALAVTALDPGPADRVLELGCGPGHAAALLAPRMAGGEVHAIDRSATMLAQAHWRNRATVRAGRIRLYRAAFEALPFADETFDRVLAVNVAYFWDEGSRVLAEVRRVLRPGGRLVIYVSDAATMRHWRFAGPDTHRLFDANRLSAMLRGGGFREPDLTVRPVRITRGVAGLVATATIRKTTTIGARGTCVKPFSLSPN